MNDLARQKLCELVARFGTGLVDDPQRTEGLLRDVCGEARREIFVLMAALKERVASELRGAGRHAVPELLLGQLTHRLADNLALSERAARWAVETWAIALGVIAEDELQAQPQPVDTPSGVGNIPPPAQPNYGNIHNNNNPWADAAGAPPSPSQQSPPAPQHVDAQPSRPRTMQLDAVSGGGGGDTTATLVVSKLGRGQFTTISRAIQQARPGDRILVRPGLYVEGLIIDRPLEIVGDGPIDEIIVDSSDGDCITMVADYAVVRGLTLRGRAALKGKEFFAVDIPRGRLILEECDITSDSSACIAIHGQASPILRRCTIHDGRLAGLMVFEGGEASVEDCDLFGNAVGVVTIGASAQPTLRRCRIHDGKTGISSYDGGRGVFEECAIFGNSAIEVQVRRGGNPTLRKCKIRDGKAFGVYVYEKGQGTFEDCDIFGCANANVVICQGGNPTLRRSTVRDGMAEGIYTFEDGRGLVEDCDIFGHRHANLVAMQNANPIVQRSKIHGGESVGVYISDNGMGTFHDCDIFGNGDAGVDIDKGGDPSILGGRIHDGRTSGVQVRERGRATVERVEIYGHPVAGVRVVGGGFPILRKCRVHDHPLRGVFVDEQGQGLVEDCDIYDNGMAGVEIAGGGDPVVRTSRINRNGAGVMAYMGGAGNVERCDLSGNARGPFDVTADCHLRQGGNRI